MTTTQTAITPIAAIAAAGANQNNIRQELHYVHAMCRRAHYDLVSDEVISIEALDKAIKDSSLEVRFEIKARLARLGLLVG
jgi:hypothetical protein